MKSLLTGLIAILLTLSTSVFALNIPDPPNQIIKTVKLAEYDYQYNTNVGTTFCHGEVWATYYLYGPPITQRWEICVG